MAIPEHTIEQSWRPIIISFLLLVILLLAAYFSGDLLATMGVQAVTQSQKVFHYSLQCAIWLSGAYFINTLVNYIIWDRVIAPALGEPVPRLLKNVSGILVYAVAVTGIIGIVFERSITGIWATSGAVGIVLGLALQSTIRDVFIGLAVNIDKPYTIGNWIVIHPSNMSKGMTGQVQEVNWRTTRLVTSEGNSVIIPNSLIGASIITNYSTPESHSEIELNLRLAFTVEPERARRILLAAATAVANNKVIMADPAPKVRINAATAEGIEYRIISVMCSSPGKAKDVLLTSVLDHLHQAGLTLAYPQQDIYHTTMPQRSLDGTSVQDRINLLRRIELFAAMDDGELSFLAEKSLPTVIRQGQSVFSAGAENADQDYSMYVLVEGLLYATVDKGDNGQTVRVGQITPGQFFGEMSLLTGVPRSATITAATSAIIYEITQATMAELLQNRPAIMEALSVAMADRRMRNEVALNSLTEEAQQQAKASMASQLLDAMSGMFGRIWSRAG